MQLGRTFNMINLSANTSTMQMERTCPRKGHWKATRCRAPLDGLFNTNDSQEAVGLWAPIRLMGFVVEGYDLLTTVRPS